MVGSNPAEHALRSHCAHLPAWITPDRHARRWTRWRETAGQAGCRQLPRTVLDGGHSPASAVWVYRPSGVQIPEPPPCDSNVGSLDDLARLRPVDAYGF